VIQELVDEGRRELDAKRSMVRHVSHEIRYVLVQGVATSASASARTGVGTVGTTNVPLQVVAEVAITAVPQCGYVQVLALLRVLVLVLVLA
jgi:hypothetical protein